MSDESGVPGPGGDAPGPPEEKRSRRRFRPWRRRPRPDREAREGEERSGGEPEGKSAGGEPAARSGGERETRSGGEPAARSGGERETRAGGEPAARSGGERDVRGNADRDARNYGERPRGAARESRSPEDRPRGGNKDDRDRRPDREARTGERRPRGARDGRGDGRGSGRAEGRDARGDGRRDQRGDSRAPDSGRGGLGRSKFAGPRLTGVPGGQSQPSAGSQGPREVLRPVSARGVVLAPPSPAMRVIIAGGGTGGHIYPALAVADEIRRRNRESRILFVGTRKGLEARLVPESGYEMEYLELSGFAGRGPLARLVALVQLARGVMKMRQVIRAFQPELVLGTGGYVSGPAVLAAHWGKVPTMIQEQNSIPGKMNRFLSRFAREVHVAFTESRMYFREPSKVRLSGNPARIRQPRGSQVALYRKFDLDPQRLTVLVMGGSRGARSLNKAIVEAMPLLSSRNDLQFVIQTGQEDEAMVRNAVAAARVKAEVRAYFAPIEEIYAVATIVVCRAGAMTLAEIAQFGLPAILVPFPFAIYQHQLMNAKILEEKGAAEILLDKDLGGQLLAGRIEALLADQGKRRNMGQNAWNLARPDAHERVVNAIESLTHPVEKKGAIDLIESEEIEEGAGRSH